MKKTKPPKWTIAAPARSPFDPDGPAYQIRHLRVKETDGASIRAGLTEAMAEAVRLAPANLDASKSLVLFVWDPVYCRLTVTFTDGENDARDVLKVSFEGWDRKRQKAPLDEAAVYAMEDGLQRVRYLLYTIAKKAKPRLAKLLPKRKIRVRFKGHSERREWTLART
jgi:hypothetical protein